MVAPGETVLVLGATGATGRLLATRLLDRGFTVRAIVRPGGNLPPAVRDHPNFDCTYASVLELGEAELARHARGCGAVASCLGHNLTLQGVFGRPRRLVREATERLCEAIKANAPEETRKFLLMNTSGNRNRDLDERVSFAERCVLALLRACVPPHADNEAAADFLRSRIGRGDRAIEWVAVRPDGLIDEGEATGYELHPSPIRSAIFDAGKTSRINVAHFMADLISDSHLWEKWKGQMPVIYNAEPAGG